MIFIRNFLEKKRDRKNVINFNVGRGIRHIKLHEATGVQVSVQMRQTDFCYYRNEENLYLCFCKGIKKI